MIRRVIHTIKALTNDILIYTKLLYIKAIAFWGRGTYIIMSFHYSLGPSRFKIDLAKLLWTLENPGSVNVVIVPEDIKVEARPRSHAELIPLK